MPSHYCVFEENLQVFCVPTASQKAGALLAALKRRKKGIRTAPGIPAYLEILEQRAKWANREFKRGKKGDVQCANGISQTEAKEKVLKGDFVIALFRACAFAFWQKIPKLCCFPAV